MRFRVRADASDLPSEFDTFVLCVSLFLHNTIKFQKCINDVPQAVTEIFNAVVQEPGVKNILR